MKAIKSTKQVTKAMELVSASKMRKASQNVQMLRRYALTAWDMLQRMANAQSESHPFFQTREPRKTLAILFTSDRGLCGSLNTQMVRLAQQFQKSAKTLKNFERVDFVTVGKRGQQSMLRLGNNVVASFPALSNHPSFKQALPIARIAIDEFSTGAYDQVVLLYPDCVSALLQMPVVKQLLPLSTSELRTFVESLTPRKEGRKDVITRPTRHVREFNFEPSPEEVLNTIVPRLIEMQMYQAVLETAASEHSARMVAMRNATDNASDLLDDLTLLYNQTRQARITGELAELSASKAALE